MSNRMVVMSVTDRFSHFVSLVEDFSEKYANVSLKEVRKNGEAFLHESQQLVEKLSEVVGGCQPAAPTLEEEGKGDEAKQRLTGKKPKARRSRRLTAAAWANKQAAEKPMASQQPSQQSPGDQKAASVGKEKGRGRRKQEGRISWRRLPVRSEGKSRSAVARLGEGGGRLQSEGRGFGNSIQGSRMNVPSAVATRQAGFEPHDILNGRGDSMRLRGSPHDGLAGENTVRARWGSVSPGFETEAGVVSGQAVDGEFDFGGMDGDELMEEGGVDVMEEGGTWKETPHTTFDFPVPSPSEEVVPMRLGLIERRLFPDEIGAGSQFGQTEGGERRDDCAGRSDVETARETAFRKHGDGRDLVKTGRAERKKQKRQEKKERQRQEKHERELNSLREERQGTVEVAVSRQARRKQEREEVKEREKERAKETERKKKRTVQQTSGGLCRPPQYDPLVREYWRDLSFRVRTLGADFVPEMTGVGTAD
eukprot:Cvel_2694.t1-p1 / transcript=Cvel_2694.t1 / gene=Cvel_2694 / organism=Chromera_velia_CCMP2878 / gene_product=hypothetical protein / transcript_product=hypothetical protein / location=Cvel_scaffold108:6473-7906(-) / protein_length=478 / sequence_SO=supercontig / SO=protein_coding / is_pseudo=false